MQHMPLIDGLLIGVPIFWVGGRVTMALRHPSPLCSFPNLSIYALVNLNAPFENVFGGREVGVAVLYGNTKVVSNRRLRRGKSCVLTSACPCGFFCTLDRGPLNHESLFQIWDSFLWQRVPVYVEFNWVRTCLTFPSKKGFFGGIENGVTSRYDRGVESPTKNALRHTHE